MEFKGSKRIFAFVMALSLCTAELAGCADKDNSSSAADSSSIADSSSQTDESMAEGGDALPEEEEEPAVIATAVNFSKVGQYTTTVSSEKIDLSGVTADNTEVTFIAVDAPEVLYYEEEEPEESEDVETGEEDADEEDTDRWTYSPGERKVKIDEIKANGTGWDITFTDEDALVYAPESYHIIFRDLDETAYADVEYKDISVSSDTEGVNASDKEAKITLTLEGSEFENNVTADDITLGKAFEGMSIESLSASGKNLTMQLKGTPAKNKGLGIQESGAVTIDPSAVKDGYEKMTANVEVQTEAVYFDSSTFSCKDGKLTADLIAYDSVDVGSLTNDNVKIDGLTVEAVEKKDEHTAAVTVKADSANEFAKKANGKKMTLNGYETEITIAEASFYPVFDYCEENGDDLKLTIYAYSISGTFDSGLKADAFSFGRDFEGAKVESAELESDTVVKLIISVPSNGQTADALNMTGEITLAADSLVNNWGEKQSDAVSNSREYSNETLGRANKITLSKEALLEIQKYTRGRNTLLGELCYWGGNAGTVFSLAKTGLEVLGILESDHVAVMKQLREINMKLDQIQDTLNTHTLQLEKIDKHLYEQDLSPYFQSMESMLANYNDLIKLYKNARDDYAPEVFLEGEELPRKMKDEGTVPKSLIDWENASDKERAAYSDALTDICLEGSDNRNSRYYGFATKRDALVSDFHEVVNQLTKHDVFGAVDTFASYEYNFDTQAYYYRCSYRESALANLEKVMALLHIIYKTDSDPYNHVFEGFNDEFLAAVDVINNNAVTSLAPEDVDVNARTVTVKKTAEQIGFISEVKIVAAGNKKSSEAKKALTDEGFTVVDQDLNAGAGGDDIYLGYKKTDNYNDAIKGFYLLTGKKYKDYSTYTTGGRNYYSCPANFNKDLNKDAGGDYIYMFYTKDAGSDGTAVTDITFNSTKSGSVCTKDLNADAGGADIYMHLTMAAPGQTYTVSEQRGYDPAYHPYCYSLGKTVRLGSSKGNKEYYNWSGALVSEKNQRGWSDVEYTRFMERIKADTIKGELADAGITLTYPLIMKLSKKSGSEKVGGAKNHKTYTYYNMSGDLINLDSLEVTTGVKLSKLYANTKRRSKNERYQEFNYLYLD